jgi:hypothetical protein
MNTGAYKVTFGDGSALYVEATCHDAARVHACLQAWNVCGYWPTVIAVEKE